jgi:hypothetical protein
MILWCSVLQADYILDQGEPGEKYEVQTPNIGDVTAILDFLQHIGDSLALFIKAF